MIQVLKGEEIIRVEPKQKKKRVRRRKQTEGSRVPSVDSGTHPVITKPAT